MCNMCVSQKQSTGVLELLLHIVHVSKKILFSRNALQNILSLWFFISVLFVNCFNNEGHEAIGMTAMSALKGNQLYELKKLLNGKDLVDIGKWGHLVHKKIKNTEKIHFNLQDTSCANIQFTCEDEHGLCLLNSIKYFYYKLLYSDSPKKSEQMGEIKFKYPRNIAFTDSDSLKYLVSLLSDMHQPLRLGFLRDNGGKDINISYLNAEYEHKITSLFNYLENEIIDKMVLKYSSSWYGGWTHVNRIFDKHKKDEALFEEKNIDAIETWAKEIVSDFCEVFYSNIYMEEYKIKTENDSFIDKKSLISMSYELEYELERLIRNNILNAGSRISIIINHLFLNKKFSSLRKKSEFDHVSDEEMEKSKITQIYKSNALFINISIFFLILLIMFYVNMIINRSKNHISSKMEETELQEKYN